MQMSRGEFTCPKRGCSASPVRIAANQLPYRLNLGKADQSTAEPVTQNTGVNSENGRVWPKGSTRKMRGQDAVIAGEDEFNAGEVTLKDLKLGAELASGITDRDEWRKGQPAQMQVKRDKLVEAVKGILGRG